MFMTQSHTEELLGRPFSREQFWRRVELYGDDLWYYVNTAYSRIGDMRALTVRIPGLTKLWKS